MNGIEYRLKEIIHPQDGRSLIVDASSGLALGALPGLENFEQGLHPALAVVEGIVCSPGQLRRFSKLRRDEASLLVRVDWTNTLRGEGFVMPPTNPYRVPILSAHDALDLGAVAMVGTLLLGYEEEIEASCMRSIVEWAITGKAIGMPLIVEVMTTGPLISLPGKAIELGASFALEGGADGIIVPYPGTRSLETVAAFVSVPWLLKPTGLDTSATELEEALDLGATGLFLDHRVFGIADPATTLTSFKAMLHQPASLREVI
jgi:DhnA family fructose-bisphosphate aldolase class Ia